MESYLFLFTSIDAKDCLSHPFLSRLFNYGRALPFSYYMEYIGLDFLVIP
jgi:hypothetical protein